MKSYDVCLPITGTNSQKITVAAAETADRLRECASLNHLSTRSGDHADVMCEAADLIDRLTAELSAAIPRSTPALQSMWQHYNGQLYIVTAVSVKYPVTIFYESIETGSQWSRPMWDWHRSMTEIK